MSDMLILTLGILVGLIISCWAEKDMYKGWLKRSNKDLSFAMDLLKEVRKLREDNGYLRGKLGLKRLKKTKKQKAVKKKVI